MASSEHAARQPVSVRVVVCLAVGARSCRGLLWCRAPDEKGDRCIRDRASRIPSRAGGCASPPHRPSGVVWALVQVLSDAGIPESACRVALSRLAARRVVTPEYRGRPSFYRITDSAATRYWTQLNGTSLPSGGGVEPGYTILWHTPPESSRGVRNRLSRRLRFIGFGSPQDGTWIALQDR